MSGFRNYETYAACAEGNLLVGYGRYVIHATPYRVSDQKKTLDICIWQLLRDGSQLRLACAKLIGWRNNLGNIKIQ